MASVIAWVGIIGSVIGGLSMMAMGSDEGFFFGILMAAIGSIVSWIGSFFAYGFGQLIENSDKLVQLQQGSNPGAGYAPYSPQYNGVNAQPMYGNGMYGAPGANQNGYYNGNNQQ